MVLSQSTLRVKISKDLLLSELKGPSIQMPISILLGGSPKSDLFVKTLNPKPLNPKRVWGLEFRALGLGFLRKCPGTTGSKKWGGGGVKAF